VYTYVYYIPGSGALFPLWTKVFGFATNLMMFDCTPLTRAGMTFRHNHQTSPNVCRTMYMYPDAVNQPKYLYMPYVFAPYTTQASENRVPSLKRL
jgi:hypothetical protein